MKYRIRLLNAGGYRSCETMAFPVEVVATEFAPGMLDLYRVTVGELNAKGATFKMDDAVVMNFASKPYDGTPIGCELIEELED